MTAGLMVIEYLPETAPPEQIHSRLTKLAEKFGDPQGTILLP